MSIQYKDHPAVIKTRWNRIIRTGAFMLLPLIAISSDLNRSSAGLFDYQHDIGTVGIPGCVTYDAEKQEYCVEGSGANIWFDHDAFYLVWKKMSGDFILNACAEFPGTGVNAHRKTGWMIRTSLDANSTYADVALHGDGLACLQFRRTVGGLTEEVRAAVQKPDVLQLERKGTTITMSVGRSGDPLVAESISDLNLGDTVLVGLFICSHEDTVSEKAIFHNVRIIIPARDNFIPYRDYIGSHLEILDVETRIRKIIYSSAQSLQAPNWTPDGTALIYNSDGKLYRFDLERKEPVRIDTDFADRNNNDHVVSPDGSLIGISHHDINQNDWSTIYTVPIRGGRPRQVTSRGPSYLHDWSPDGRFLIYTAERNGDYDIYKISTKGGKEIQLTRAAGLDDGSQYTPDGKYIYFNSVRSGTMQIWRMKADGSEQEQVTFDLFNNWFPHISPDGKWIVFLSYSQDVKPAEHPFYKHVYLRLMPVAGGQAEIIAYVYGGQGTINVSSWSPDSRKIAFISNSDLK
jgi:TolB protein